MKKILGLDLGTNSIGWALVEVESKKILGMGSRIIPMGADKQDYEKGVGITKNVDRRTKRTIRKINKRYKLRRNKLLYILHELGMLPEQFQFKSGIPEATKIQELELLPIPRKREYNEKNQRKDRIYTVNGKRVEQEPDSILNYKLRAKALNETIELKELGKILYSFNQLRGYSGGNNDEETKKKNEVDNDENESVKKYEVFNQKVLIQKVEQSDTTFQGRGKNKEQKFNKFNVTILFDDEELEGETELQNLKEKEGQEEELEIRIRRNKKGETTSIVFALPQKTNWRNLMEKAEEDLKKDNLHISQLIIRDLAQNKWSKIRNRVFLRNRYQAEFDAVWDLQSKSHDILKNCPKEIIEKIANYLFPGKSKTQENLRQTAIKNGLKYIIKEQVIYYQRPLKSQIELISKCQFEKDEQVLANSHPLFQEFRCWKQINNIYVTSKVEVIAKNGKTKFTYQNRYLTDEEKKALYAKLQTQKQVGFNDVKKIANIIDEKTEYLNGLNVKAKLIGCDTQITIKKILGENFETLFSADEKIIEKIWKAIFDNANNGSEYDTNSIKVSSIKDVLNPLNDETLATELALKFAQSVKFPRKYASFSEKAIHNILPLMQPNPVNITDKVRINFTNIQHLIETGEILDENLLEDYVIDFVENNPKALEKGELMEAFAVSLVYGKHTAEPVKPQIKDYHNIKYENRKLRNPIVEQISNETMQVIKAIWKQYKFNPEELEIRVELARDLKNSAKERDKIYKAQIQNKKINDKIKERLTEEKIAITDENILKYKLYEQQNFMSPYSGNTLQIALFDTYEIDHIIPKSRYFDDSFSNKVLVEGNLNKEKGNRTAWEYLSTQNSAFGISPIESYIENINRIFYGKKKKNLLLEKIPTNPVERQIKDTQYISVAVKNELAKIVGSENVKTTTGEVTDFLRSRWGLRDLFMRLTKDRFKQMELWDINSESGQPNDIWVTQKFDEKKNKNVLKIKNWSKRYDHRHHAIDALVVALTEQGHIQRLNNLNKYLQDELNNRKDEFKLQVMEHETALEAYFNLEANRREEIQKQIESSRHFEKPIEDLISQTKKLLETMIISIKPKDKLGIKKDDKENVQLKIKGALHQETNYGKTKDTKTGLLRDTKTIDISKITAKDIAQIIDQDVLAKEIDFHRKKYDSIKEAFTGEGLKTFNESRFQKRNPNKLKPPVYKVKVWYSNKLTEESTLQRLYENNDKLSVVTGDNYLFIVMEKEGKRIFDIASLYDSADIAMRTLKDGNENYRQIICEDYRLKHSEKPEKVLFTLQQNDLVYLPSSSDDPVLRFNNAEFKDWLCNTENKENFSKRVYKAVKFDNGKTIVAHFVPHTLANIISIPKNLSNEQLANLKVLYKDKKIPKKELNHIEYGSYRDCSPYEAGPIFIKSLTSAKNDNKSANKPLKIQESCIKLKVDWIGNVELDIFMPTLPK